MNAHSRIVQAAVLVLLLVGVLVAFVFSCTQFFTEKTLTIRNESMVAATVQVDTWGAIRVEPGAETRLELGRFPDPHTVFIYGPFYRECSWKDATRFDALVIRSDGASCEDRRNQP